MYLLFCSNLHLFIDETDEEERYIHKERYIGECSRSFYIGENLKEEDIPESVIIISDMQFDAGTTMFYPTRQQRKTLMENIRNKYETETGYKFPKVVYWNVSASNKSIPELPEDGISFVSGYSPSIFTALLTGKTSLDLMLEVLNSERYSPIF